MPHRRLLDALAEAIHERWRATIHVAEGKNPNDVPFKDLSPEMQDSNRAAARRITGVLAVATLDLDEGVASDEEESVVREHIELHLESLAEAEHEGWMAEKQANGWQSAPLCDDTLKRHNCLQPFDQLSTSDQDKDRAQVRGYPEWARLAGWRLVFSDQLVDGDPLS